jgi:hypothetical protein
MPALLCIIFILQWGINSVFLEEWRLVPLLKLSLTGQPWLDHLSAQSDENRPVFPHLIFVGLAYLTSYNVVSEMILGWIFLSVTVFILWRILLHTFPQGKWIIIPIAWLAYSFSQDQILLWGEPAIAWYLTILMIVLFIHFLNKIKDSQFFIIPVVICGFVASFSVIAGLSVWTVGFLSFKTRSSLKLLLFYVPSVITCFVLFFNNWTGLTVDQARDAIINPLEFLAFVLTFLGNAVRIRGAENYGINATDFSNGVGLAILDMFLVAIFLYRYYQKSTNQNVTPWLQFAILGILLGIITAWGRLGIYGLGGALESRYVPLSNFFLIGTLVIVLIVLFNFAKTVNSSRGRKIVKTSIIILLLLSSLYIALSYVVGYIGGVQLHKNIATGTACLMNIESASDDCLRILYPSVPVLKERAQELRGLCLGPFAASCK